MKSALPSLLLVALLSGCASLATGPAPAPAAPQATPTAPSEQAQATEKDDDEEEREPKQALPNVELTPQVLHRLLLAEIAGQRGLLTDSAELYFGLAKETRDPRIARRAAEIALHGRRTPLALEAVRLWLSLEPNAAQARQTLIRLLALQGNREELKTELASLLAADPQNLATNLMHLGRLFARGGDRNVVRDVVDAVTEPYLRLPEAHYARAHAAFEAQDMPAARGNIRRALELKPDWEAAALFHVQLIENRAEAIAALADFVAANPRAREARLAYARTLVGEKRLEEARREFAAVLEQSAGSPRNTGDIVFALAVLSLQLNDPAAAEPHLRKLVEIGHAEADKARYYLGLIAEERKQWNEALRWFAQVGSGEQYLPARLHSANVLAKQGKLAEARRLLSETETATPRERAQLSVGEAQLLREAGQLAEAYAALSEALALHPDQPELLYETALIAERLGRPDELETRLRRLIEIKPDHAHAYNALGYSLADRKVRLPEALSLIERALELSPNDPFILDSKGWVLFRLGETQSALDTLKQAFGIRPDPEIAAHVGEVLWSLGRKDEAREVWEKARRAHPANEALAETIKRLQR
jgi:tetratricopeptide (TPR) repeat protein